MISRISISSIFLLFSFYLKAQNLSYAKDVVKTLCSYDMSGRGYVNDGDKKAADFIKKEYQNNKLSYFNNSYFQNFGFPVVTFPGKVDLSVDDVELIAGYEFIISPGSHSLKGKFKVWHLDSATIDNPSEFSKFRKTNLRNYFILLDNIKGKKFLRPENAEMVFKNTINARGHLFNKTEKLTWGVSTEWNEICTISIIKGRIKPYIQEIELNIEAELKLHNTQNVVGYFQGSKYPDSFIVFTAHYDHLGILGKDAYFPGANDNASGVAMMLDLVKYYSENRPSFSVAFIAFAAEEADLIGSYYYTQNPLFELKKISFLINLDLMGTGDKGMTAVNATIHEKEFDKLQYINGVEGYLPIVNKRAEARNSDHYYFSQAGVKSFFFYLLGDYHFYHDVDDTYENLPFSGYDNAFKLVRDFGNSLMR